MALVDRLLERPAVGGSAPARELAVLMTCRVHTSTSGFPYLQRSAWTRLRDWVPHILSAGPDVLTAAGLIIREAESLGAGAGELDNLHAAERVIRQIVLTASITAPAELWLLRHVFVALHRTGISERLLAGEALDPRECPPLIPAELRIDLRLLLTRGYLVRVGERVRLIDSDVARAVVSELHSPPAGGAASDWAGIARGELRGDIRAIPKLSAGRDPGRWHATAFEIELGARLVSLVVGLRAADRIGELLALEHIRPRDLVPANAELGTIALSTLQAAGVVDRMGALGDVGRRVLERGPGPFGIIEAYHPYAEHLDEILRRGRRAVSVNRATNISASQDANRRSFERAHDALDRFCADTGFRYDVFIEHACGRAEATRQRWERSGAEAGIRYFGADLEDAAIDAAIGLRNRGALPSTMRFVRNADIANPDAVIKCVLSAGASTEGAVMMVGNGFHEVRDRDDAAMTKVFAGYERAGIVLIFTEESALPLDALLETAWNTYHAGFRYVHERSGQILRPAAPQLPSPLEDALPASWTECAERGGYVQATAWCTRTRTIYPYTPPTGHNPAISVNHVFVPGRLARQLGIADASGDDGCD